MANETKGWVHVRVKCPDCGESIWTSWPPDDREDHLVKHGTCSTFRLGRKEAVLQQLANAVEDELVNSGPGLPEVRRAGIYRGMREKKSRVNPVQGGDREEGEAYTRRGRWKEWYGRRGPGPGKDELGRDRGDEEE